MVIIHSKKFIFRPFRKGDENSLIENINNKKIAKNTLTIPYPYKMKDARFWINRSLKLNKKKKKTEINFAIDIGGKVVGGIGFNKIQEHCAEIGYWLGEKYWGQGIMTAAVKLATKYAFEKLGLRRIYAFVFLSNKASARVLRKAGFKYEGKLRKHVLKGNRFLDDLLFAKIK
ncbi:MAG: GNAT family N-acetyltransferase [bacterium]|nr:GNAT family N-acetyltransferase [bacterium]